MLRWSPLVRATSNLAGDPVVFDFSRLSYLTLTLPDYQPIVRDLETVRRRLLRKNFGVRVTAQLGFQVSHSRALNSAARYYEVLPLNHLQSPFDLSVAPWSTSNASVAVSPAKDPLGTFRAYRVTDATGAAIGLLLQNTGISAASKTGEFSLYVRADSPHVMSIGIQDNIAESIDSDVNAETAWRRVTVRKSFTGAAANFQAMIRPTQLTASLQGNVDVYLPTIRRIVELPGTDEEILSDLKDKLCSDDWRVELSLDGLTYREVLLDAHEKTRL